MTKLEVLHDQITKEQRRMTMLKNTKGIDVDFMRDQKKSAEDKIKQLQKEFDYEYAYQNY